MGYGIDCDGVGLAGLVAVGCGALRGNRKSARKENPLHAPAPPMSSKMLLGSDGSREGLALGNAHWPSEMKTGVTCGAQGNIMLVGWVGAVQGPAGL